jgi:hypothetical protein
MCGHTDTETNDDGIERCCTCGMWRDLHQGSDEDPAPWMFPEEDAL